MKYTAVASPNNQMSNSRQFSSLSPKMAATYSEGFKMHYNSPKTQAAKGFVLPKSNNENLTLLTQTRKGEQSSEVSLSKALKSSGLTIGASTPSQKITSVFNINSQMFGIKDEKKNTTTKGKEPLRTMSSTPKGSGIPKTSEPLRTRDATGYNSNQYIGKWKKLEISTEFNSSKGSYGSRAQTTKHTEVDENVSKDLMKTSITQQSLQSLPRSLIGRVEAGNSNEQPKRAGRPLSSSDANPKNLSTKNTTNGYQARSALFKENIKAGAQESGSLRSSYKREKLMTATPKVNQALRSVEDGSTASATIKKAQVDLRASWQAGTDSAKKRPSSAKKVSRDTKEEQQIERNNPKDAKTPTQKVSLQGFVTQVSKGDAFSSIKKYSDKRENSAQKVPRKSYLTLEEKATKPVRAVELDLRGPQTTPNVESKTFTISLNRNVAQSPNASSFKQQKNTRYGSSTPKDSVRSSQELESKNKVQAKEPFIYYMSHMEKAHRWNGDNDYFVQVYREHFLQTFQALSFCKMLKPSDQSVINQKRVNLPRKEIHKNKKTLVFDMDETLIHCNESSDMPADVILPIIFPNGEVVEAGVNVRPYALEILRELSPYYEIIVFTASHACYANVVLDYLDPHEQYISHRLFRESCVVTEEGVHIKDLRVIGNRNLRDLILVDNAAYSFGFQVENGIPIIPFYDNKADQELRHLIPYLKFLSSVEDLREINKQTFKLHMFAIHDTPEAVLDNLFVQQ